MTPALGIMTAGCSSIGGSNDGGVEDSDGDGVIDSEDYAPQDPDVQDESDVETSTEEEEEETDQEEQEQESDSSDDEQLVEYDSVVDLLPEPNTIATDDDWQVTGVEQDPDTDLQVDVTAFYTVGGAGAPSGNVAITAYDNISDAEQRYDDSFANAELEAESVDDTTPVNTDETYRAQIQRSDLQASRLKNVFFQVSSSTGHTTDIHAAIVSHLNDKIVSE
jgi:hypothetical protein